MDLDYDMDDGNMPEYKVPVTIVTGFLGSGKSTLLNHILSDTSHGQRFAVIENELGKVAIDDQIIRKHLDDEEIIEVTNGCICCSIRGDLVRALNNLYKKIARFDGVLIETTGLADPAPIIQTFFQHQEIMHKFHLEGVVTLVDSKSILTRLREIKPEGTVNEAVEQIAFADRVILNKTDLLQNDETKLKEIEEEIRSISPTVSIIRTVYSKVDDPMRQILQVGGFEVERALDMDPNFLTKERKHRKDRRVKSIAWVVEGEVLQSMIQGFLGSIISPDTEDDPAGPTHSIRDSAALEDMDMEGEENDHDHDENATVYYRYKGVLAVKGVEEKFLFQGVNMTCSAAFTTDKWLPGEKRTCKLVFIGKNLDADALQRSFEECLVRNELRFNVGDKVMAYMRGMWRPGAIVGTWDEGNPYRIFLENEKKEIWAPADIDEVVQRRIFFY